MKVKTVYEVFVNEFVRALLEDELGENLFPYFHITLKKYLILDVILERPDSTLWDRKDTPAGETPQQILETALSKTYGWLEEQLGSNPRKWEWGEYKVTMLPGLRMVIPLDDVNAMKINMPLGQSCQPGHEHYDDLVDGWAAGKLLDFPVRRADVEATSVSKLILSP